MIGGNVIFCDDIRQEEGGKTTFVGCYKTALITEAKLPATLAKLGMLVIWSQSLDEERYPVEIQVFFPGDAEDKPALKGVMDFTKMVATPSDLAPEERQLIMEFQIVFSPLELKEAGAARVIAIRNGKKHSLRRLEISSKPADPSSQENA